ncbi:1-aminocyclopropane-1-carboxylate oxidase homolog 4-like [Phragmites australis]|uniref:1-aminocyclopropane-1-carboxylate oxidase homolog 4-like n=1 Tax=Phragmites australis TaxID=29695 RepID=UPI002D795035|nr:1-aminocyclopropane-1-carboxylate oxidase homolog 4-like [Phragmites australis]
MTRLPPSSPVTCRRITVAEQTAPHRRQEGRWLRARVRGEAETDDGDRIRSRGPSPPSLSANLSTSLPRNSKASNNPAAMASPSPPAPQSDRAALLKAFDESRTGVRGLVESGVSSVPALFLHPDPYASVPLAPPGVSIPVVDLSLPAPLAAAAAAEAARDWGFFHLVNHHQALGVPADYPSRALAAVHAFNELPAPERASHYSRAVAGGVNYSSNVDLFSSRAVSWRDTIQILFGPQRADPARIPAVCREEILEWDAHTTAVGRALLGLLSEGLGLGAAALEEASCLEGKLMACHYYPVCPEPERTMGIVAHTDPGVLTVLAQDAVGGLQVKQIDEEGRSHWVDAKPVPGALVINVGDLLQIMSNDKYKSVEHRVIMNTREEARVSIAIFFNPGKRGDSVFYGPLAELVSSENPPKYRNFTMSEFLGSFFKRDLASKALIDHFKL